MDKFDANRRKLLALGGVALGAAILPTPAFATLSTPRPRILTLNNLHTGESIKAEFFDGRGYIQEELAKLNHFFRDYRANKIKSIDPGLFDQLYRLQGLLGTRKPVQLISGYRSIDTNNELRARSRYPQWAERRGARLRPAAAAGHARFHDHAAVSEASLQALSGPHRVSDRRGAGAAVFT